MCTYCRQTAAKRALALGGDLKTTVSWLKCTYNRVVSEFGYRDGVGTYLLMRSSEPWRMANPSGYMPGPVEHVVETHQRNSSCAGITVQ